MQNVTIDGTSLPEKNPKLNKKCSLVKGEEIIFVKAERAVTQTYQTGLYTLTKDLTWEVYHPERAASVQVKFSKGSQVEDVSYLAEGLCEIRAKGTLDGIYEACCFSTLEQDGVQTIRKLEQEAFVLISCKNGGKAWFTESMLNKSPALESFFHDPY